MSLLQAFIDRFLGRTNPTPQVVLAVSDDGTADPVAAGKLSPFRADPTTGAILTSVASGASGGTVAQGTGSAASPWGVQGVNGGALERLATQADQATLNAKFTDGTVDNNIGSAVSKTVKSGAGRLIGFTVRHAADSALYFWLFDNTSATGTQLLIPFLVPASSQLFIGTDLLTTKGVAFSTGLTYGLSTSGSSYSAYGTAANVFVSTVYS